MRAGEHEQGWTGGPGSEAGPDERSALGGAGGEEDAFERLFGQLTGGPAAAVAQESRQPEAASEQGITRIFAPSAAAKPSAGSLAFSASAETLLPTRTGREALPRSGTAGSTASPVKTGLPEPPSEGLGEFTRIFTQLPKPRSSPPAILAGPTQAFATDAGSAGSAAPVVPVTVSAPPARVEPGPTFMADAAPEAPAHRPESSAFAAESAGETRIMPGLAQGGFSPAVASTTSAAPPVIPAPQPTASSPVQPPAEPKREPGEFTQFFQALSGPKEPVSPSAPAQPAPLPPAPMFQPETARAPQPAPSPVANAVQPSAAPFAPATEQPHQPGAFTAFFQSTAPAQSAPGPGWSPASEPARPQPPAQPSFAPAQAQRQEPGYPASFAQPTPAASAGFTELMQTLSADPTPPSPQPTANAFSSSSFAPAAPQRSPENAAAFAPQSFAPQPPLAGRPGEFTELMQTLQAPPATENKPSAPAAAPFFSGSGQQVSSGGPSEFTRIMQSSAARSAQTPAATFAPAPAAKANAPAVGLPIAPPAMPPKPTLPEVAARTKLQTLMPWLLAANGLLLLLLMVLAWIFLHHRH